MKTLYFSTDEEIKIFNELVEIIDKREFDKLEEYLRTTKINQVIANNINEKYKMNLLEVA